MVLQYLCIQDCELWSAYYKFINSHTLLRLLRLKFESRLVEVHVHRCADSACTSTEQGDIGIGILRIALKRCTRGTQGVHIELQGLHCTAKVHIEVCTVHKGAQGCNLSAGSLMRRLASTEQGDIGAPFGWTMDCNFPWVTFARNGWEGCLHDWSPMSRWQTGLWLGFPLYYVH